MKRLIIYAVLLGLLFVVPVKKLDIGKLQPIEVVSMYIQDSEVFLETDTGDVGKGVTALDALRNLKETATGVVYLDTAEFLLVQETAQKYVDELRQVLKDNVKVCLAEGDIDPETAAKYLNVHGDLPNLREWELGDFLPVLSNEKIIEKSRK